MARFSIRFLSKHLLRRTEVNLIIPSLDLHGAISKGGSFYEQDEERFPLAVLLSGFGDDDEAWLTKGNITELCEKYRFAAAMIGGENKWYLDLSGTDNWHQYITQELPDFLYGNFSRLDRGTQIIGGVSMGGYGALYNGLKAAEQYKAIMALSPATRPDDYINEDEHGTLREAFLAADKIPCTYLCVGDRDFIYGASQGFDMWLAEYVPQVRYKFVPGMDHSWRLWAPEAENFFRGLKERGII